MKKFGLGLVVSLIFLYLLITRVNIREIQRYLYSTNLSLVITAVIVHLLGFYLRAVRWGKLLEGLEGYQGLSSVYLFRITSIGYMFNNILPFRLGDLVKGFILARENSLSRSAILATIFVEKITDGLALVVILALAFVFIPVPVWIRDTFFILGLVFIIPVLLIFTIAQNKSRLNPKFFLLLPFSSKIMPVLKNFWHGLGTQKNLSKLLSILMISLMIWVIEGVMVMFVGLSLNLDLGFLKSIFVTSITNLAITIPSAPGYIGPFEFFMSESTNIFGIDHNLSVSFSILTHLTQWLPITFTGIIFSLSRQEFIQLLKFRNLLNRKLED